MAGWIKLHRSLACSAVAAHPEYLAVWIHLLMKARHAPGEAIVGRMTVPLNAGDLIFGRKKFSVETGVSENKVRAALDVLKRLEQITIKSETKFSVISITKWAEYQSESPANNHKVASKPPADSQQIATNKNVENVENVNSNSRSPAKGKITFNTWLSRIKAAGEKPVPDDHAVIKYAEQAGIPHDYLAICWSHFKGRYTGDPKKYIDWRKVFHNSVRENWFKLWWLDNGEYKLTSVGQQGQHALNSARGNSEDN